MKILILNWRDIRHSRAGGAEKITYEHAKYWISKGHLVSWFTSKDLTQIADENINKIRFIRQGSEWSTYLFGAWFAFWNQNNFDVVIDQIHGVGFFTPVFVRKPTIALIHEIAGSIWDVSVPFPMNLIGKQVEKLQFWIYRNTRFWVGSISTKNDLIKVGIPEKNITSIPYFYDGSIANKLPTKKKNPTYIYVGRLVKMKGIEDVIKAFYDIQKILPESILWVIGTGRNKYINKLIRLVDQLGIKRSIVFWGWIKDRKKILLMRQAHLLLHGSIKEGWGLNVFEAAAQGTPTIGYNVAGLKDSILNNRTGILVDVNRSNLAYEAIKLFKDKAKYQRLQLNCLSYVKKFTKYNSLKQSEILISTIK